MGPSSNPWLKELSETDRQTLLDMLIEGDYGEIEMEDLKNHLATLLDPANPELSSIVKAAIGREIRRHWSENENRAQYEDLEDYAENVSFNEDLQVQLFTEFMNREFYAQNLTTKPGEIQREAKALAKLTDAIDENMHKLKQFGADMLELHSRLHDTLELNNSEKFLSEGEQALVEAALGRVESLMIHATALNSIKLPSKEEIQADPKKYLSMIASLDNRIVDQAENLAYFLLLKNDIDLLYESLKGPAEVFEHLNNLNGIIYGEVDATTGQKQKIGDLLIRPAQILPQRILSVKEVLGAILPGTYSEEHKKISQSLTHLAGANQPGDANIPGAANDINEILREHESLYQNAIVEIKSIQQKLDILEKGFVPELGRKNTIVNSRKKLTSDKKYKIYAELTNDFVKAEQQLAQLNTTQLKALAKINPALLDIGLRESTYQRIANGISTKSGKQMETLLNPEKNTKLRSQAVEDAIKERKRQRSIVRKFRKTVRGEEDPMITLLKQFKSLPTNVIAKPQLASEDLSRGKGEVNSESDAEDSPRLNK